VGSPDGAAAAPALSLPFPSSFGRVMSVSVLHMLGREAGVVLEVMLVRAAHVVDDEVDVLVRDVEGKGEHVQVLYI